MVGLVSRRIVESRSDRSDLAASLQALTHRASFSRREKFPVELGVAPPPSVGLAREEVELLVDGQPQMLEIVRQERIHGQQA